MSSVRQTLLLFCILLAVVPIAFASRILPHSDEAFAAFYCAGEAVDARVDPYLIEPLRTCEHRVAPNVNPPTVVEPAPLPGYSLLPFAVFARLPYRFASALFLVIVLAAVAATAIAVAEITALPVAATLSCLIVVDCAINASFGETPPLAIAALALAGLAVSRGRDRPAAWAAAAAMIEPHLGLAACASLFLWRPGTRLILAFCGVLFAGVSLIVTSPAQFIEYYAHVLPLQSRAETAAVDQYSLTWLAHVAGANDTVATTLGSISFVAFVAIGVFAARSVARAYKEQAMLVFFPAATSVLFGVFVHDIDLTAAVLAALVIASKTRRYGAWITVAILSVAWMPWWRPRFVIALSLCAIVAIGWAAAAGTRGRRRMVIAAGVGAIYLTLFFAFTHLPHTPLGAAVSPWPSRVSLGPAMQAGLSWGTLIRAEVIPTDQTLQLVIGKIVVWAALASILVAGLRGPSPNSRVVPGSQGLASLSVALRASPRTLRLEPFDTERTFD